MGDTPTPEGMFGPIAMERPRRGRGDVGVLGTPVRDHAEAIEQEEQEGKADGDNGAGEECIKWEIDGKRRQRGTRQSA